MRVSNAFIVLCLFLGTLQARAADVVVMRDGSEHSGTLELCADDQCRLSGKRIAIEEIRAIFLDGPRKELPVRSSAIVMRDSSVRTGRVTFVNRGTVDTEDEEFDRSRVAAIIFSGASDKPLSDLLILRNGSVKSGALTTCNAASCTLDGAITPLANIEWVGLAREDVIPPSSTADEVHKIDGTIIPGRLSGINESRVSTTRGPVLRAETAWVHLAPPAPPQPPQQPPTAGNPPPSPGGVCERGALWTGTLRSRKVLRPGRTADLYNAYEETSLASLRLREILVCPLRMQLSGKWQNVGSYITLVTEGSTVTWRETSTERSHGELAEVRHCSGEGTVTHDVGGLAAGFATRGGAAGWLYLKSRDVDFTPMIGFDIPRASGRYRFSTHSGFYPVTCQEEGRTWPGEANPSAIYVSRDPREPSGEKLVDPEIRGLVQGRMQGSYAVSDGIYDLTVSWMLCREGSACPPPPELPEGPTQDPDPAVRN